GDADDTVDLFPIGFCGHALERGRTAFMNHLRYIGNFTAHDAAECRTYTAEKTHRLDAVANHNTARDEALQAHAVDFVTRQTGQFRCALHAAIVRYSGLTVDARSQTQGGTHQRHPCGSSNRPGKVGYSSVNSGWPSYCQL